MTLAIYSVLFLLTILYIVMGFMFFRGLGQLTEGNNRQRPSVSVIIAARNEVQNITACIESLIDQSYPQDAYEIIVVDDQSIDGTARIVEKFASRHSNISLISIRERKPGWSQKKFALTTGIDRSKGKIILTTDADCTVLPSWIEEMILYFESDVGFVGGYSQIDRKSVGGGLLHTIQSVDFFSLMCAAAGTIGRNRPMAVSGQNLGYRKKAFEAIGGFEGVKERISGDDVLLLQLIAQKTEWRVRFAVSPGTFVTTQPVSSLKEFFHQRTRWASNSTAQMTLNRAFFMFLLSTFCFHLMLLFLLPFSILTQSFILPVWICFLGKSAVDFLVLLRGSRLFHPGRLLSLFPLWEVFSIPLVVFAGVLGVFGRFTWKGRDYTDQGFLAKR